MVDTVVGLEYDGCCWIGRVVLQRLQSSVTQSNLQLLFQMEFVGFAPELWCRPHGQPQAQRAALPISA